MLRMFNAAVDLITCPKKTSTGAILAAYHSENIRNFPNYHFFGQYLQEHWRAGRVDQQQPGRHYN